MPIGVALNFSPATRTEQSPVQIEIEPDRIAWSGQRGDTDCRKLAEAGLRAQLAPQSLVTGQLRVDLDFRPDTPMEMVGAEPDLPEIPSELDQLRSKLTELPLRELIDAAERARHDGPGCDASRHRARPGCRERAAHHERRDPDPGHDRRRGSPAAGQRIGGRCMNSTRWRPTRAGN